MGLNGETAPSQVVPPLPMMQNKVVLVMDLVESVRLMAHNEASVVHHWHSFLQHAREEVLPLHGGRLVKSLGDGILVEFDEVAPAARATLQLHRYFDEANLNRSDDDKLWLRAGLNATHLYVDEHDVFGHGVNLAARVAGLAGPGETMITANVHDALIDGVDGTLARRFRVTEVLPNVSGKNIDFVIDFASYAIVPAYMIYESGLMEGPWNLAATFLILLVSAVYYGKEGMVSNDYYFVGFPVLWNLAAFYMIFVFQWGHWGNVLLVVALSILHFVPIKVAYPSRATRWRWPTLLVSALCILTLVSITYLYPERQLVLTVVAWVCLAYFAVFAVWATWGRPAVR